MTPSSEQSNSEKISFESRPSVTVFRNYIYKVSYLGFFAWRLNICARGRSGVHTCFHKHLHTCKHGFRTPEQVTNMEPGCHWLPRGLCFWNESPAFTAVISARTWALGSLQCVLWCCGCWIVAPLMQQSHENNPSFQSVDQLLDWRSPCNDGCQFLI